MQGKIYPWLWRLRFSACQPAFHQLEFLLVSPRLVLLDRLDRVENYFLPQVRQEQEQLKGAEGRSF